MALEKTVPITQKASRIDARALLAQYGCGPIHFTGSADALYERHLLFDNVVDTRLAGARERFEAIARSVRYCSPKWIVGLFCEYRRAVRGRALRLKVFR